MIQDQRVRLANYEGEVNHLYLDSIGKVTVGIGHRIPNIEAVVRIPFLDTSGQAAARERIQIEYRKVRDLLPDREPEYYRSRTLLRVTTTTIDALVHVDLLIVRNELTHCFTQFESFPRVAQEALIDLAFNTGAMGLITEFPKLVAAAKQWNWNTCAVECVRGQVSNQRNQDTIELFRRAALVDGVST